MKTMRTYKVWSVLYPIGMYYVTEGIVFFFLQLFFSDAAESYMLRQAISAACTIPVIHSYYAKDKEVEQNVYGADPVRFDRVLAKNIGLALFAVMPLAVAVNNLLAMTPLMEASDSFNRVNDTFFAGAVIYELLGSCLVIPAAEELLFRGVVYKRLKLLFAPVNGTRQILGMDAGSFITVCLSAFLFGLVHFNVVQFLYAGILGIALAIAYEKTNCLYVPILGHIAANAVAVLRAETGFLSFAYQPTAAGIGVTAVLLVISALAWKFLQGEKTGE